MFALTRWVALAILPFLAVAVFLLYGFPARTGELFAWPIDPPLSAYLLASAYLGGIWFFVRVVAEPRWHRVTHGFPAVVVFAGGLLIATLLHLDRFSHNLSFVVWVILYATTPVVIAVLGFAQRRQDPGFRDVADIAVPRGIRLTLAVIGGLAFLAGATLFVAPALAADSWAWTLTPLTGRVTGAVLTLTGVVNAAMLWDERWSAFRILFQAQLISLFAIALSLIVRRDDLIWDRPLTPLFIALVGGSILIYGAVTVGSERSIRLSGAISSVPR